ncbi:unnamed protein product [Caenorhabditis bovis]|uniref:Ground-like domain-containing protein n=1 Tax=Caenorhabditis bovis TaxID=2654633 RepID=A0A8S1ECQ2_9PELO|nr:unnamed protein product [Caenorhabditis bovis]
MRISIAVLIGLHLLEIVHSLFFPSLGFGSPCHCQTSCNAPPPSSACLCAPPPCAQSSQSSFPSFLPYRTQPLAPAQYIPQNYAIPQPQSLPPPPPPPAPPQILVAPQRQQFGYESQQQAAYVQSQQPQQPSFENQQSSLQRVQLQPPSKVELQYVNQLMTVFDGSKETTTTESYNPESLSRTRIEVHPSQEQIDKGNTVTDDVNEVQPEVLVAPAYIPHSEFNGSNELRTTELKLTQTPFEEVNEEENKSNSLHNNEYNPATSPVAAASSTENYEPASTTQVQPSFYTSEQRPSSSLPPISLEYMTEEKKTNGYMIDHRYEIDQFKQEVDKYHSKLDYDEEEASENIPDISEPKKANEKVAKCNSSRLKNAMHKKMTISPSISKQMIYSAASELFPGRNVNVICSRHSFSYIVVTSPVFCEHRKRPITCFAFFQP